MQQWVLHYHAKLHMKLLLNPHGLPQISRFNCWTSTALQLIVTLHWCTLKGLLRPAIDKHTLLQSVHFKSSCLRVPPGSSTHTHTHNNKCPLLCN